MQPDKIELERNETKWKEAEQVQEDRGDVKSEEQTEHDDIKRLSQMSDGRKAFRVCFQRGALAYRDSY